jgi:hypothetical protein
MLHRQRNPLTQYQQKMQRQRLKRISTTRAK